MAGTLHRRNSPGKRQPTMGRPVADGEGDGTASRAVKNGGIAALVALTMMYAAGCDSITGKHASSSTPPQATTMTANPSPDTASGFEKLCSTLSWPRPMPPVVGWLFTDYTDFGAGVAPLTCLNGVSAIGPDGRIVYEHNRFKPNGLDDYRIAAVSPPPGTPVGPNDPVTVNLVGVDDKGKPAYHPCDWVTDDEAAGFLGAAGVGHGIEGSMENLQGVTNVECPYYVGGRPQVYSVLHLTAAHVVDAESEFAFQTAQDSTSITGIGIKAACTTPRSRGRFMTRDVYVLLPGERIYVVTGRHSCDTLTQFARVAVPRIGA
jgi:hypothetical protein